MAKKEKTKAAKKLTITAEIDGGGIVVDQPITRTIEENYMPYAMSVIVSRALPEIDGFKPSHRKILFTMYKMGLLSGTRTKSANIVGQTMKLNPHGDQAIYETMVRLARGNEALLHPYVDSKGNFGKAYSRDMAYAASRYTEAKLEPICQEFFRDIEKQTVDFVPNYDNQMLEPTLLPASFPSILVNSNVGIAVSMASNICPFHLGELCTTTIALIENPESDLTQTLNGPDFPSGGYLLHNPETLKSVFETGRGSFKIRSKYNFDKHSNCLEITQLPPTTTIESVMDKIVDLIRQNKIREIADMRDETDLSGLKIAIDLKRGVDAEKLMARLFRMTPLEDSFSCNFNLLIDGKPKVLGVRDILLAWISFRMGCIKRRTMFELQKKKDKLHLLEGLAKILLDIDKAISIVRETAVESEVVVNLMIGFGISEIQAEYVAEIKLRHLNREYILKRTEERQQLLDDIVAMEALLASEAKMKQLMILELGQVITKYEQPRKTMIIYLEEGDDQLVEEEIPNYPVHLFLTQEGYFKKITPQSYRMSSEQKLKETDSVLMHVEAENNTELLFFTDKMQVYKTFASEFDDQKASVLGDFIPAKLGFDENEKVLYMVVTSDYAGELLFFFQNGKVAKVPLKSYETKTKRKKLANAYSDKSPLCDVTLVTQQQEFMLTSTSKRVLLFDSAMIAVKSSRDTQGVSVMTLKKPHFLQTVAPYQTGMLHNEHRYRMKVLPAAGALKRPEDSAQQLEL